MPGKSKTVGIERDGCQIVRRRAPVQTGVQKSRGYGNGWDGSNAKTNPHITPPANPNVPIGKQVH